VTRGGSTVRELPHPAVHGNRPQRLAEAVIAPGAGARLHWHAQSEEIYCFTAGHGLMTLGAERFAVRAGDSVCIAPGTHHGVENAGDAPLRIVCSCAPAYRYDDTFLV
jgi:mannose-6-phosphate isomerase-like protein (cupin superfamily)